MNGSTKVWTEPSPHDMKEKETATIKSSSNNISILNLLDRGLWLWLAHLGKRCSKSVGFLAIEEEEGSCFRFGGRGKDGFHDG
jgi:hypothetical protein